MRTDNRLPAHLERIGLQLVEAAESLYATDPASLRRRAALGRMIDRLAGTPRLAIASGIASLAAVAAVIGVFATSGALPAYALTQNANGSYTITINDIATGVPALNIKLKQLGINATAVPVTDTCSAPLQIGGPDAITERSQEALSPAEATAGADGLLNLTPASIPVGSQGVIAAYQSPSGQINLTFWTTSGTPPDLHEHKRRSGFQPVASAPALKQPRSPGQRSWVTGRCCERPAGTGSDPGRALTLPW
jgi:hypothetical protein